MTFDKTPNYSDIAQCSSGHKCTKCGARKRHWTNVWLPITGDAIRDAIHEASWRSSVNVHVRGIGKVYIEFCDVPDEDRVYPDVTVEVTFMNRKTKLVHGNIDKDIVPWLQSLVDTNPGGWDEKEYYAQGNEWN